MIDAWKIVQSFGWGGEFVYPFFKILLGLVFQICFFGSVGFWAWYEATSKTTGSSITITEGNLRKIQLALLAILGVMSLFVVFDMFSTSQWGTQRLINNAINYLVLFVALTVPILVVETRLDHKQKLQENKSFEKTQSNLFRFQRVLIVITWIVSLKTLILDILLPLFNLSNLNVMDLLIWGSITAVLVLLVIATEVRLRKNEPRKKRANFKELYEEKKKRELKDRI